MSKKPITDPNFDVVKLHSKQKHQFLEGYLRIWTEHVGGNKGEAAPSLRLFDLYAGTGECKEEYSSETWKGTAVLLAECLAKYPTRHECCLYVNSYNEDDAAQAQQRAKIEERVKAAGIPKTRRNAVFGSHPVELAVGEAEKHLDRNYPSLWILDPWRPQHLPWSVVEQVANLKGITYQRRPEMLVNLMTYQLCQNIDNAPHIVTTALGMPEPEWRPKVNALIAGGMNTRQALVEIYGQRLADIYGRPPWVLNVPGVDGNIVYVLFLCVEHDAAFHSIRKIALPEFEKWQVEKFKPKAAHHSTNRGVDRQAKKAGHEQKRLGL